MHADRALDFAAPAEEAAQREMQLDRLRVDFDHFDERLDRLVGLLVQQKVEPLEIGHRQRARFGHELLDVDARGEPAEREEQRQREQPPVLEFHVGCRGALTRPATSGGGGSRAGAARARCSSRFRRDDLAPLADDLPERREKPERGADQKNTSSTKMSGARHSCPRK